MNTLDYSPTLLIALTSQPVPFNGGLDVQSSRRGWIVKKVGFKKDTVLTWNESSRHKNRRQGEPG